MHIKINILIRAQQNVHANYLVPATIFYGFFDVVISANILYPIIKLKSCMLKLCIK